VNQHPRAAKPFARILKWAGGITAILSLFFGLYQLATMVSEARARARQIDEAVAIGKAQQGAGDYSAAWESFSVALASAETGGTLAKMAGKLDERQVRVRAAQEDDAMEWLRNIHTGSDEKFSDTVDKVLPALVRGLAGAQGTRKADLLAHVGWAYFLKSRDGPSEAAPEKSYAQAVQADAGNPYAHAYWGHWILWNRGSIEEALKHFSIAVAGGRERDYVRQIELSALENNRSATADAEYLAVVGEMQVKGEPMPARARSRVYSIYSFALYDDPKFSKFTPIVPPERQIAVIRALLSGAQFDASKFPTRDAAIAVLEEARGEKALALAAWKSVRTAFKGDDSSSLSRRAAAEIKRLSR
jgi:tetratricopeptide (TPR) repeat protein